MNLEFRIFPGLPHILVGRPSNEDASLLPPKNFVRPSVSDLVYINAVTFSTLCQSATRTCNAVLALGSCEVPTELKS